MAGRGFLQLDVMNAVLLAGLSMLTVVEERCLRYKCTRS
jgi:hypothetical protein